MPHPARPIRLLICALLALALLSSGCMRRYEFRGTVYDRPSTAPEIVGTNWDGSAFRLGDLNGRAAFVFFGYTNCPDVCPTTLAEMRVLKQSLGAQAARVAVVFVSVDPERDTVARLAEYIPVFDASFYGVHIEPAALEPIKQAWGVVAEKRYYEGKESATVYSVDHTARVFLVDPGGLLRASYAYGTPPEDFQADVEHLIQGGAK